jgi:CheY-like chemotaxis protein
VILIVEDDVQVARLISLVLQRGGYESRVVADGQSALDVARVERPQLVFADLKVKGMSGEALCQVMRGDEEMKDIPFVIVSGDRDIAEKARSCGASDHLGKPFEFDDLLQLVRKHVADEERSTD